MPYDRWQAWSQRAPPGHFIDVQTKLRWASQRRQSLRGLFVMNPDLSGVLSGRGTGEPGPTSKAVEWKGCFLRQCGYVGQGPWRRFGTGSHSRQRDSQVQGATCHVRKRKENYGRICEMGWRGFDRYLFPFILLTMKQTSTVSFKTGYSANNARSTCYDVWGKEAYFNTLELHTLLQASEIDMLSDSKPEGYHNNIL